MVLVGDTKVAFCKEQKWVNEYEHVYPNRLPDCRPKQLFKAVETQSTGALSAPLIKTQNADYAEQEPA